MTKTNYRTAAHTYLRTTRILISASMPCQSKQELNQVTCKEYARTVWQHLGDKVVLATCMCICRLICGVSNCVGFVERACTGTIQSNRLYKWKARLNSSILVCKGGICCFGAVLLVFLLHNRFFLAKSSFNGFLERLKKFLTTLIMINKNYFSLNSIIYC